MHCVAIKFQMWRINWRNKKWVLKWNRRRRARSTKNNYWFYQTNELWNDVNASTSISELWNIITRWRVDKSESHTTLMRCYSMVCDDVRTIQLEAFSIYFSIAIIRVVYDVKYFMCVCVCVMILMLRSVLRAQIHTGSCECRKTHSRIHILQFKFRTLAIRRKLNWSTHMRVILEKCWKWTIEYKYFNSNFAPGRYAENWIKIYICECVWLAWIVCTRDTAFRRACGNSSRTASSDWWAPCIRIHRCIQTHENRRRENMEK